MSKTDKNLSFNEEKAGMLKSKIIDDIITPIEIIITIFFFQNLTKIQANRKNTNRINPFLLPVDKEQTTNNGRVKTIGIHFFPPKKHSKHAIKNAHAKTSDTLLTFPKYPPILSL